MSKGMPPITSLPSEYIDYCKCASWEIQIAHGAVDFPKCERCGRVIGQGTLEKYRTYTTEKDK